MDGDDIRRGGGMTRSHKGAYTLSSTITSVSLEFSSLNHMDVVDKIGLEAAIAQAKKGYAEGGIPIGSSLVYHGSGGEGPKLLGSGHNERIQKASATLHGEISALEKAGRLKADVYRNSTMAS